MKNINTKYLNEFIDNEVKADVDSGLELLNSIDSPIVTFLGSHVGVKGDSHYDIAYEAGKILGSKGFAVMTGGGPGVMEAGNKGAKEVGADSIGITAYLIKGEKVKENNLTHRLDMKYMFVRRFILSIKSQALIVFPGGYGTFNELFEFVTLMQVNMVDRVPIILIDRKFWAGLTDWIQTLVDKKMIDKLDLDLLEFADDVEELVLRFKEHNLL